MKNRPGERAIAGGRIRKVRPPQRMDRAGYLHPASLDEEAASLTAVATTKFFDIVSIAS